MARRGASRRSKEPVGAKPGRRSAQRSITEGISRKTMKEEKKGRLTIISFTTPKVTNKRTSPLRGREKREEKTKNSMKAGAKNTFRPQKEGKGYCCWSGPNSTGTKGKGDTNGTPLLAGGNRTKRENDVLVGTQRSRRYGRGFIFSTSYKPGTSSIGDYEGGGASNALGTAKA